MKGKHLWVVLLAAAMLGGLLGSGVLAVFDVTRKVVSDSSSIIAGNARVNDIGLSMLQSSLMQMDVGPLFGLFLQSFFIGITMRILSM